MLATIFVLFLVAVAKIARIFFERQFDITDAKKRFNQAIDANVKITKQLHNR